MEGFGISFTKSNGICAAGPIKNRKKACEACQFQGGIRSQDNTIIQRIEENIHMPTDYHM